MSAAWECVVNSRCQSFRAEIRRLKPVAPIFESFSASFSC